MNTQPLLPPPPPLPPSQQPSLMTITIGPDDHLIIIALAETIMETMVLVSMPLLPGEMKSVHLKTTSRPI
jgi:hypothetical protein